MTKPSSSPIVVVLKVSDYVLSEQQIENVASEFYGKTLDSMTEDDSNSLRMGFEGISAKSHSEQFKKYIDTAFIRAKKT